MIGEMIGAMIREMIGIGSIRLLLAISVLLLHGDFVRFEVAQIAVLTFFYISGFLMERSFTRYSSWQRFVFNRLLRLLPSLLLVSLATWLIIVNSSEEFRRSFGYIYLREATSYGPETPPPLTALATFEFDERLPYMGFQGELVPQSWSIGNEIVYYLTIPLLALLGLRWLILLTSLSVAFFLGQLIVRGDEFDYAIYTNLLSTYSFFIIGYLVSHLVKRDFQVPKVLQQISALLAPALIVASYFLKLSESLSPLIVNCYVITLSTLITLGFLVRVKGSNSEVEPAISRLFGSLSYPLYVSHMIVIGYLNHYSLLSPALLIATAFLLALAIYSLVDRPLEHWRLKVRRALPVT